MEFQITIRGRRYTLRSDGDDDLEGVARYVDSKMAELGQSSFDDYTIALMTALNIASEYRQFRKKVAHRLGDISNELTSIGDVVDAALPPPKQANTE